MDHDELLEADLGQLVGNLLREVNITPVAMETSGMQENLSVVYVVGKQRLRIKKSIKASDLFPGLLLRLYIWMRQLSRSEIEDIDIPINNMFEIGIVSVI